MKKTLLLLSSVFALAACGQAQDAAKKTEEAASSVASVVESVSSAVESATTEATALKDGEYALETEADERGWAHTFTITVKDGKVTASNYDMKNAEGQLKSASEEYNTKMKEASKVSFAEAVEKINADFLAKQSAEVETVTGATNTTTAFKEYAKQLLAAAAEGKTETIKAELIK